MPRSGYVPPCSVTAPRISLDPYVEGRLKLDTWTGKDGQQHAGLSVASWKVEKLAQIGRNKQPKPIAAPEGEHSAPVAARDWQRPPDDGVIPF